MAEQISNWFFNQWDRVYSTCRAHRDKPKHTHVEDKLEYTTIEDKLEYTTGSGDKPTTETGDNPNIYTTLGRQDDTGLTGIPVPRNTIIPTFSHGDWLECKQKKRVSISNIVRIQKYETPNMLKSVKHKSINTDMLEIVDGPVQTQTKENNYTKSGKNKSCVKWFVGNCSSFSEK